jgi:hypothetical protein
MFGRQSSRDRKDALAERIKRVSERLPDASDRPGVDARPVGQKAGGSPPRTRTSNRSPREATYKDVQIELPGGGRVTGVVRNVSATGARIDFSQRMSLPAKVRVSISGLGVFRNARVVWQDERSAGIVFL